MPDDMDGPAILTSEARRLADEVAQLAHDRRCYRIEADALELRQRLFEAENASLMKEVNDLNSRVGATEKRVRAMAENIFIATGEKHPHPSVEIKMTKVVTILDAAVALAWATEKRICLKLDTKALEALAKASPANVAGIATLTEEARAQIARELTTPEAA